MVITMAYGDGIEVFDTAERVDPAAYRGNALTNWSIRLEDARSGDALGGKRLWLDLYAHELPGGGQDPPGPRGMAVAQRRDVASFLLADEGDVARLLGVSVGGEAVLVRVGGELVNSARLAHAAALAFGHIPQAVAVRAYLEAALGESVAGDPVEEICAMMGFTPDAYAEAEAMHERGGRD